MTPGQLIDLLEKAGMLKEESPGVLGWHPTMQKAERFAALLRDYFLSTEIHSCHANCERFACVQTRKAVEAEREKLAKWMIDQGYATGHGDTTEGLLEELDWQITESWSKVVVASVQAEHEACIRDCDSVDVVGADDCIAAIRARGKA